MPDLELLSQLPGEAGGAFRGEAVRGGAGPGAPRHLVFTVPRSLRGLFGRDRRLLGLLSRSAYEALRRTWAMGFEDARAVPGMVASIQTFGSFAKSRSRGRWTGFWST